jgi:hypothetical protein
MQKLFGALVLAGKNVSGGHFLLSCHHYDIASRTYFLNDFSIVGLGQRSVYTLACHELFHSVAVDAGFGSAIKNLLASNERQTALKTLPPPMQVSTNSAD